MEITINNGEKIKINEHVYCASNWAIRDGTPYSVARVMEFLSAEGTSNSRIKAKGRELFTRVRIAWYYRPGDISDRQITDSRLLLAAIYTEIIPISHIRGRCWVRHKDKIPDLTAWRKKPDRFYYQRMFDPFIKKEFDVLPTVEIHNLPRHIKDVLASRYEYVVAEKEVITDLVDALRLCETCGEWCPTPESVQCASCKNHFHMGCVQPPLAAKPSRGYGWTCAPCARRREDEVDANNDVTTLAKPNQAPKSIAKMRSRQRKDRQANLANPEEDHDRYFKMWPFRYFGAYVNAEDAMDPDDLIFVRAPPRLGQRFQVTGLEAHMSGPAEYSAEIPERGGDATIEVFSSLCNSTEEDVELVEERLQSLTARKELLSNADWLNEALRRLNVAVATKQPLDNVNMKNPLRLRKWAKSETRYTDREWSEDELVAFEDALSLHGAELRSVREEVHTRSMPEIVRQFGLFKADCLRRENRVKKNQREAQENGSLRKPAPTPAPLVTADEEESVIKPEPGKRSTACAACGSTSASCWWKAPKGLATALLCDFCGIAWRKYGDLTLRSGREEALPSHKARAALTEKREGTPLVGPNAKKAKVSATSSTNGIAANMNATIERLSTKQLQCSMCRKVGPLGKVLKCSQCALVCHAVACGAQIQEGEVPENWVCDPCQNEKSLEASLDNRCLLCPKDKTDDLVKHSAFLRALKPTEGQGWVHVLCALFFPEIQFSECDKMKTVEGISMIPAMRWRGTCRLCDLPGGAVVRCSDCPKEYHVSCAFKAGFKVGFEIMPVKNSRKEFTPTTTFKRESGIMNMCLWCDTHLLSYKRIYDLCEVNPETGESAIQVFCRTYKQVLVERTHGLLRKAQRLDHIMSLARRESAASRDSHSLTPATRCRKCETEYSPFFHPKQVDGGSTEFECHRCHFEGQQRIQQPLQVESAPEPVVDVPIVNNAAMEVDAVA